MRKSNEPMYFFLESKKKHRTIKTANATCNVRPIYTPRVKAVTRIIFDARYLPTDKRKVQSISYSIHCTLIPKMQFAFFVPGARVAITDAWDLGQLHHASNTGAKTIKHGIMLNACTPTNWVGGSVHYPLGITWIVMLSFHFGFTNFMFRLPGV